MTAHAQRVLDSSMPASQRTFINAQEANSIPEHVAGSSAQRPSAYLRSRCEACFGGTHTSKEKVQVILCLDANFQQKRNRDKDRRKEHRGEAGTRDPPVFSPRTVILPHHFVEEWERKDRDSHTGMRSRPAKKNRY
jgi:hypothetical protein